ncbi:23S rRNA (adenine(2503)-C(2))-methyltransferase [Desulfonema ishimotonii]|uniref:Probable dual-specificity RNA methyltransferase RlmN n=2 Tax=Desulfonema ishimotonii TaxID=45657 RepID=A0A401FR62_9BACT|nr:23S rRNA (adenine(2503)-C(2))-methyltransferase [Desulfonema ishimotonii]
MQDKTDIKELSQDQLVEWLKSRKMAPYRARQIFKWIYMRQADSFEAMTDLSNALRLLLVENFTLSRLKKRRIETSSDGSKKYLFCLTDGSLVESVLIPEKDHYTLCISSQVGCAQGCAFCLTATGGFVRHLSTGEIVAQVRDAVREIPADDTRRLSNIVFMGMGEPLANYKNVIRAVHVITDSDYGLKFSPRRITLSTAGLVPQLEKLGYDTDVNLAISLNATDNKTRDQLMPINRKYPLEKLLEVCRNYPLRPRRRITFEYILIKGVNDSPRDAGRLAKLLQGIRCKINLIAFNEHAGSDFRRSDEPTILRFQEILHNHNYTAVIRYSKGLDISAACGQLKANEEQEKPCPTVRPADACHFPGAI